MVVSSSLVNAFLFKPPKARDYDIPTPIIKLKTRRGSEIGATYLRRGGANVTILFSHGNAEDLNSSFWFIDRLSKSCDVNIMCYDYTGYGSCSDGVPSEEDCYADIDAAYEYLLSVKNMTPEQIVVYGRSVGSGPSCYLAAKTALMGRPVAGLILHSPFTSVYRVVFDWGFTVLGDKFPNIDRVRDIQCPVLLVHGQDDAIVPFKHGQDLQGALPEKIQSETFFVKGMGHNAFEYHIEVMLMSKVSSFLDYHVLARRLWMKKPSKKSKQRRPTTTQVQTA